MLLVIVVNNVISLVVGPPDTITRSDSLLQGNSHY